MSKLTSAATILFVKDVVHSVNWYIDRLGFSNAEFYGDPVDLAIIEKDANYIVFSQSDPALFKTYWKTPRKINTIFFWVDDIETLYQELLNNGAKVDYELYLASWGGKEFGIKDPDEYDISFGENFEVTNPFCLFR